MCPINVLSFDQSSANQNCWIAVTMHNDELTERASLPACFLHEGKVWAVFYCSRPLYTIAAPHFTYCERMEGCVGAPALEVKPKPCLRSNLSVTQTGIMETFSYHQADTWVMLNLLSGKILWWRLAYISWTVWESWKIERRRRKDQTASVGHGSYVRGRTKPRLMLMQSADRVTTNRCPQWFVGILARRWLISVSQRCRRSRHSRSGGDNTSAPAHSNSLDSWVKNASVGAW